MSGFNLSVSDTAPVDWDAYVAAHADASVYHTARAIGIGAQSFGLRTHYVCARDADGRIRGVLPLIEQTIVPWTRTFVSVPFFTYGGPIADDDGAIAALVSASESLAVKRDVKRIVLRMTRSMPSVNHQADTAKVSMVLELPDTTAELASRLGSKLRSQIKRAERVMPEVHIGHLELLEEFYPVFCSVMRDLGTPVYPRRFFEAVMEAFGNQASLVVIRVAGQPVSGAVTVRWRDSMEVPWAATLHGMNPAAVNMRLYWELLQFAVLQNCRRFDFGRCSRDVGTYRFKAQWGACPVQLHWLTRVPGTTYQAPSASLSTQNKFGALVNVWRRMPLPLTNWLGPRISHRLPW